MAMKVFNVGDVLAAADVNEYLTNTKYITKPNDTTRISTISATNDPDLSMPVDANKSYFCEWHVLYNSNSTANIRMQWTMPASATFNGLIFGLGVSVSYGTNTIDASNPLNSVTFHWQGQAPAVDSGVRLSGVLATAGSAGNFTLQWAQDTSTAVNTIVRAGSSIYLRRVA